MDRATLLQIFQSRLERSDYSKLQKQGRTFYQEARRQASNTQARYIFVSFLFVRAEEVCVIPCVCVPFFAIVAVHSVWFRFYSRVFPVYVSAYTGPVVVLVAVVMFRGCRRVFFFSLFYVYLLYSFLFHFFVPVCSCIANVLFLYICFLDRSRLGCISPEFVS